MSTHDLISWADIAGTQMCKVLFDFSSERDEAIRREMLKELRIAVSSFQAVTERLLEIEFMLD